jgi:hypothetical protein
MAVQLGNYDPTQQAVIFNGVIIDGYADDTFIKVTRNEDTWMFKPSNSGGGARSRNPNRSGRFEFTLHSGSPSNAYLSTIARTDELAGTGVGECQVSDRNTTGAKCFAAQAWVVKPADYERQKEVGNITWIIEGVDVEITHVGLTPLT